jgi:hypothetical protein
VEVSSAMTAVPFTTSLLLRKLRCSLRCEGERLQLERQAAHGLPLHTDI